MNKFKIIFIVIVVIYLGAGVAYSSKASYCETQSLLSHPELNSGGKENEGSNIIGRSITTLFWPFFVVSDKINNTGAFNCIK